MRCSKPFRILLPEQVVQKDAHSVHAQTFGPTKFAIDPRDRTSRPATFQAHCRRRMEQSWRRQARLLLVPLIGLILGPARFLRLEKAAKGKKQAANQDGIRKTMSQSSLP